MEAEVLADSGGVGGCARGSIGVVASRPRLLLFGGVAAFANDGQETADALTADAHLAAFSAFAFPTLTFGWPFSFFHLGALPQSSIQASPS
mgnify:CR=1 FL=1